MIARRHMHEFGTTREQLAAVAVKNHANGALNPLAHMRKNITLEQALAGKPVAEPLTVYDCSLVSDGAAAVVLAPLEQGPRILEQVRADSGYRPDFGLRGAGRQGRYHDIPGRPQRWRESVPDGRAFAGRDRLRGTARLLHDRRDYCVRRSGLRAARARRPVRRRRLFRHHRPASHQYQRRAESERPSRWERPASARYATSSCNCAARQVSAKCAGIASGWLQNLGGSGATCVVTILGAP